MSKNKNPYESQETVDIPDFLTKREEIEQEEELIENKSRFSRKLFNHDEEDEEMSTRENRTKNIRINERTLMIGGILLAALLLLALFGFIFGISKSNALKAKELEYQELAKQLNEKDASYQQQIKKLQDEIEQLKAGNTPVDKDVQTKYEIIAAKVNVRSQPKIADDNIVGELSEGEIVTVYGDLVADGEGREWGSIGDNRWICIYIDNRTDSYAEEVK